LPEKMLSSAAKRGKMRDRCGKKCGKTRVMPHLDLRARAGPRSRLFTAWRISRMACSHHLEKKGGHKRRRRRLKQLKRCHIALDRRLAARSAPSGITSGTRGTGMPVYVSIISSLTRAWPSTWLPQMPDRDVRGWEKAIRPRWGRLKVCALKHANSDKPRTQNSNGPHSLY